MDRSTDEKRSATEKDKLSGTQLKLESHSTHNSVTHSPRFISTTARSDASVHVDSRGLHALKPNMTRNCSGSRRRSREAGGIGDMGPCNDTLVPDQSIRRHRLLAHTLPLKPSGSCHHMGSRWAFQRRIHLAIVTAHDKEAIFSSERTQGEEQNKQHVKCEHVCPRCRWTIRRFSKKFNESNSAQTCGSCDTCRNKKTEKEEPNRQGAGNSNCRGHMFLSAK